jgi:hypothetical protein
MKTLADVVSVDLPESDWRTVDEGVVFVRAPDYDACRGDVDAASFTVWIHVLPHPESGSPDSLNELMRRRVRQGRPEASETLVAGARATRFDYTDGVRHIHSYFVRRPSGGVVEVSLATYLHPTGAPKVDLETAARQVFSHLRWK